MIPTIRVLLADDHPTLRLGLRVLLDREPDIEVVAEAENGEEALEKILALQPDVAVLDCQLPGLSGPAVAREIQRRGLPVRVLALSAYDYDRYLAEMWETGAYGYLLKEEPLERLASAIPQVARGESLWTAAQVQRVQRYREIAARWNQLTEREREVLRWMAQGLSNKEIAQQLGLTVRTVDFHVGNILQKLGVVSRLEAVLWAKTHGFL
ncbi:MAG TPA: response regulator transcription factor [Thermoflexus sp.]|nr:response regulator transcription factor [Thermoflexus sp.]